MPATPQVLLDRTTPAAVLVDAALLPDDRGPVKVPVTVRRHLTLSVREVARDWATLLGEMASGEVWVEVYRSESSTSPRAALVPVVALNAEHAGLLETWPVRDEAAVFGELDALVEEVTGRATAQDEAHGVVVVSEAAPVAVLMDRGQAARVTDRPSAAQLTRQLPATGRGPGPAVGDAELPVASVAAPDEADAAAASGELDTVDPVPAGEPTEPGAGRAGVGRRSVSVLGDVLEEVLSPGGADGSSMEAAWFGLSALDEVVGGLLPGKLTLVAGAPGAGPSLLVAAVASDTALRRRLPVLYAASGLTATDVAMRVIAAQAGVNYRALRTGQLTGEEQERAATVGAQLSGLAGSVWHIDDGAGLTASDITDVARDIEGLALVVVDRLQRAHDPAVPLSGRALPAAAQALTHVARLLKVPVVAAVDTDEAELVVALDADVTLTVRRQDDRAEVEYAERDFGTLASAVLRADLACARFTDAPDSAGTTTVAKAPQAAGPRVPGSAAAPLDEPAGADVDAERELLEAARPFTSGAAGGIGARLRGALSALGQAVRGGEAGELEVLRGLVADLAGREPTLPETGDGRRLRAALAAYAPARGAAVAAAARAADVVHRSERPDPPAPAPQDASARAGEIERVEAELVAAARPFLTGNERRSPLALSAQHVLTQLRDVRAGGHTGQLGAARAHALELAGRRLRLPDSAEGVRLRAALDAYAAAGALEEDGGGGAGRVPAAVLSVAEPAAPAAAEDALPDGAADGAVEGGDGGDGGEEEASLSFRDTTTPPPEEPAGAMRGSGGRNYTFFINKITAAVEHALEEAGGDMEAATKALVRKAVPDSMALFKLTRVAGNYVHSVYPEIPDFLTKPAQGTPDQVWEGRHKWRNEPLVAAVKAGSHDPVDVTGLDTNCAFLSGFKTHLPVGALKHNPDGGFNRRHSGIHLVSGFEWLHPHLPSPLGNRREGGPLRLDEATVRLLIRCHELGLCEPPRITESWTSGASEALLEKFRRVLHLARAGAIEKGDRVTEEYVKAMYSRFTSTIGESGKNSELRRPEWVHCIRSQAFANLWLKAWKAHSGGLILVQVSGVDELHVAGGDWRQIWQEGRMPDQMKEKRLYTLGGK
ncbi:DnaB-like helicase C-terminal domain-containing protein [Streptomyces sp. NPDC002402]